MWRTMGISEQRTSSIAPLLKLDTQLPGRITCQSATCLIFFASCSHQKKKLQFSAGRWTTFLNLHYFRVFFSFLQPVTSFESIFVMDRVVVVSKPDGMQRMFNGQVCGRANLSESNWSRQVFPVNEGQHKIAATNKSRVVDGCASHPECRTTHKCPHDTSLWTEGRLGCPLWTPNLLVD